MAYYVGDIPAEELVIEPAENRRNPDLALFDTATVTLQDPDGMPVDVDFTAEIVEDTIAIAWPVVSPFEVAGVFTLTVTLTNPEGAVERVAPAFLVAQDPDGWQTVDTARDIWEQAPNDDARLFQLLELAKQQVLAYAPALTLLAPIPPNYREAQIMQARNIWNAGKVDPQSGGFGEDSFVIRPFPLDWMIKQILRPRTGIPVVG